MSHYHTSCANITIGLLRPNIPELVPDSDSETGTPLVTPIHTTFGNISNPTDDTSGERIHIPVQSPFNNYATNKGISTVRDRLIFGEYHHEDKRLPEEGWHDCPPAPRIDNGSFDLGFGLDMSVDSSFEDSYGYAFNKALTHLQDSPGSGNPKYSSGEVGRAEAVPAYEEHKALEDRYNIYTVPRTPRPNTGSWLSSTENIAPIWNWNSENQALWRFSQLDSATPSASVKYPMFQHAGSNTKARPAEELTPDAPTRIVKWNLGLGLTLDDIAEPDGYGASIGELSMEFAEDSFFDLDADSGSCSTADTTLNSTIETIPDLAMLCPNSPVGSASHALGPELGITPQLRMLSMKGHHESVKRQGEQHSPMLGSGTRLGYTTGFHSEADVARPVGRFGMNEHVEFHGLSNGAARVFVAGEYSLIEEAQRSLGHQMADAPIFELLPPIEL
ncbi:hypothetical protein RSOL_115620, partial [Rhizoctonia solani AG-3 Rhs1AP]